ncbi:hypothetical protein [Nocardia sp. NPDC051463]|uniref:hypothetical protein n=1 Tax=Nocardia sp. NPDC051463 TaxID=3154845 RepID=UPI00344AABA5
MYLLDNGHVFACVDMLHIVTIELYRDGYFVTGCVPGSSWPMLGIQRGLDQLTIDAVLADGVAHTATDNDATVRQLPTISGRSADVDLVAHPAAQPDPIDQSPHEFGKSQRGGTEEFVDTFCGLELVERQRETRPAIGPGFCGVGEIHLNTPPIPEPEEPDEPPLDGAPTGEEAETQKEPKGNIGNEVGDNRQYERHHRILWSAAVVASIVAGYPARGRST